MNIKTEFNGLWFARAKLTIMGFVVTYETSGATEEEALECLKAIFEKDKAIFVRVAAKFSWHDDWIEKR